MDFLEYHRRMPHLDPPETFGEKTLYRKLYERDPRMAALSDKIVAKILVGDQLGEEWVTPNLWFGYRLPPLAERNWPFPYVLKASHGCGWNTFVRSRDEQNWRAMEAEADDWLRTIYGRRGREWIYTQIEPRLLVEPYLGEIKESPADYKLFVFGGRTEFIQVDVGRSTKHEQFFYDLQWNRLPWTYVCEHADREVEPPGSLDEMIWGANKLGQDFSFLRVDLYEVDGRPRFGECTFYPNGGRIEFKPPEVELHLGRLWNMSAEP